MLEMLRTRVHGVMAWLIVLLIAAAFLFFGVTDYFSGGGNRTMAAKVNGEKIAWPAVEHVYDRVSRQYEDQQIDQKALKDQILMAMVQRVALMSEAKVLGFRVGEEQVGGLLLQIPAFQQNGKFSKEQYLRVLAQASYTDVGFRQELSQDVLLGQLEQGLAHSSFILSSELENNVALLEQKRDFGYLLIPLDTYKKGIRISADQIKTYYEGHKSNFVKPEQVTLEYVELSLEQLSKPIKPSKEDILAFYQKHQAAYTSPERVHARHILMMAPESQPELDVKAKGKAEALLKELNEGADFEKLAKEMSEDVGSAPQGGDLGWFVRGQMVPEFEKAIFELKTSGEIAGPVRTQFGYHLIQLVEHKDSEVRPFEQVKNLVEEQLKREKAEALFAEKGEALAKLAFEEALSLKPISEQLGVKVEETMPFSRNGGKEGDRITTHPEVLKAAFSEAILKQGHNSEPIKLSENVTIVVRVKKHEEAKQQTLEESKKQIREQLALEQTKLKVKEIGETIVKEIKQGKKPTEVATGHPLNWVIKSKISRVSEELDRNVLAAAFQIPEANDSNQQNVKGFLLPNGDYLVLVLNKIQSGNFSKMDPNMQNSYRQGLTEVSSQLEYSLYANQVFRKAKVEFGKQS